MSDRRAAASLQSVRREGEGEEEEEVDGDGDGDGDAVPAPVSRDTGCSKQSHA